MESSVASEQRSYRRGLVLGLTIAEVFVLILFSLLLVWMIGAKKAGEAQRVTQELSRRNGELSRQVAELEDQKRVLLGGSAEANRFDDLFRELRLARESLEKAEARSAALAEAAKALEDLAGLAGRPNVAPSELVRVLQSRIVLGEQVLAAAQRQGLVRGAVTTPEIEKMITALGDIRRELEASGKSPEEAVAAFREALDRKHDLEGRLRNAERRLQEAGRGTEWPACWADSSGRPEYIFDVALRSGSLVLRNAAPAHRREQQGRLPMAAIRYDADLGLAEFRSATAPLFKWSEAERCRFFVRVFDVTRAEEKSVYKLHLRTVGEHFYYYEELARPWG